ncbi:insulin-2-like [Diaphorina citri]|uniref:Insulin-2-like n=1 Tax=Diaphorina citri TaxID=121845 RepID=A0A1S3CUK7_DIACI|nr:insulin-2-like [Diaphorina citri]
MSPSLRQSTVLTSLIGLLLLDLFSGSQPGLGSVQAISQYDRLPDENKVMKICGRQLANMLSLVCRGKYYHNGKRSTPFSESNPIPELYNYDDVRFKRFRRQTTRSNPDHFQRVTKGVYDECCRESCKLSTMYDYCE